MSTNIYVQQYIPYADGDAFVSLLLTGYPASDDFSRTAARTGVTVHRRRNGYGAGEEVVLSATYQAIRETVERWPESLAPWRDAVLAALRKAGHHLPDKPLTVGKWQLPWHQRTLVMGIVNVTPDSFSDGGNFREVEAAVGHARALVEAGADIVDIGGESTRPAGVYGQGAAFVSAEEEKARIIPVISRVAKALSVPISVDTYKAEVAEAALRAGAHIVNDVWGLKRDSRMANVVAQYRVPVVVMHNREQRDYKAPIMREIVDDLRESIAIAHAAGVEDEQIILDPGIGFAKTHKENLHVMAHLEQLAHLGYPLLLGTSRKSIVGKTLNLPVDERVEGTGATVAVGIVKGCRIVRVHDVKEMRRVCRMTDAIVTSTEEVANDG